MSEETPGRPAKTQDPPGQPTAAPGHGPGLPVEFKFLSELRRRNVGRVAILYLFVSWLILQPVNVIFAMLEVPSWANRLVLVLLAVGFPAALIFAWVYELTPEGIRPAAEVEPRTSITAQTGQRLNRAIIAVLGLALAYFVADKFWLSKRVASEPSATQVATVASPSTTPIAAAPDKSIAVLPFVDMSEKKDQEYFSDGLSEQLIDLITKIPELRVPARTSSFYFKGKQTTISDIAKALGVAHVLEGSVRKSGNTLRITAQLIRADNGYHLWSETYDRELDDIFQVQDDIAGAVVKALKLSLLGAEVPHAAPTANTEAYTLYLQGRSFLRRFTKADNAKAAEYLERALELDPSYAPAWSALAAVRGSAFSLYGTRASYQETRREMIVAVERALALDPQLADGHVQMANVLWILDRDLEGAERELERALELDPANANALTFTANIAVSRGRFEEARQLGQKAVSLDPLAVGPYRTLGTAAYFAGSLDEAEAVFRKVLELNPTVGSMNYRLGLVLLARGEPAAALSEMEREPDADRRQLGLVLALDALGRKAEADSALAIAEKDPEGWDYQIAQIYAHRGDVEKAFAWLDRAYELRDAGLPSYLKGDPLLASVRQDPRYAELLRKMNLPL